MTQSLGKLVSQLEFYLSELESQRSLGTFANDVFEATDDLLHLGRYILAGNTRVNYPARIHQERELWRQLTDLLRKRSPEDQQRYAAIFGMAEQTLRFAETFQPAKDGHLGILRIIRKHFGFLQTDYGFAIVKEEPIGIRFSSGEVFLELEWAKKHNSSCSFGAESSAEQPFWIDDLLFMYGDVRYGTLPADLALHTEADVERWFTFLAGVFKQYGRDVLSNQPGIFDKLAKAQAERDREYVQKMNRLLR
ncbi:MAG TPA: hypothetical protein VKY85_22300 [Candidatus Angelobacter sp.]|nr:hypothetical protein [Candidatus Angelobacter sp.]